MHILVRVQLYTIHVVGRLSKVDVVRAGKGAHGARLIECDGIEIFDEALFIVDHPR